MRASKLLQSVLERALEEVRSQALPVYTFALYHDHESGAVSVCVDTEESSKKTVLEMNRYNMKHFKRAVAAKDLSAVSLWQANVGRSLSLGDFAMVNAARTDLGDVEPDDAFYLTMIESLLAFGGKIAALSPDPERLLFLCSGPDDEVAYVWAWFKDD